MRQRQDDALKDPFSYGQQHDVPTVSGGGTKELDKKALDRDLNRVFGQ